MECKTEAALMQLHKCENITKCLDAYEYNQKYWMVCELLDGSLGKTCYESPHAYSENCAKYAV